MLAWHRSKPDNFWPQLPLSSLHFNPMGHHTNERSLCCINWPTICCRRNQAWSSLKHARGELAGGALWRDFHLTSISVLVSCTHRTNLLCRLFRTSWVVGRSYLVLFGLMATKQLQNTVLFATASDWRPEQQGWVFILSEHTCNTNCIWPDHHKL